MNCSEGILRTDSALPNILNTVPTNNKIGLNKSQLSEVALAVHTVSLEPCNATWHSVQAIFKTPFSHTFVFYSDRVVFFVFLLRPCALVNFKRGKHVQMKKMYSVFSVQPNVRLLTTVLTAVGACPLQMESLHCSLTVGSSAVYPLVFA